MNFGLKFLLGTNAKLICAFMAAIVACCGCAAQKPVPGLVHVNATTEADRTFDYLVYLDNLACMQKYSRSFGADNNTQSLVMLCQEEASKALSSIIKSDPSPYIYMQKAELFWNKTQIAESRKILKQGLEAFPGNKTLLFALANTYLLEGMVTQAVDTLKGFLKDNPEDIQARKRLAEILLDEQAFAQALDVLTVIPKPKRDADTLYLMAKANAQLGKTDQALRQLKKAVSMDPGFIEAKAELAFLV